MKALLVSLGYFNDSISYRASVSKMKSNQYRTTITFDVAPRKLWRLDSISYNIKQAGLKKLADATKKEALIKKGDPFAKLPVSSELDRLTSLYRDSGYLRFSRDELIGLWDTLDVALLQPTPDPFEQVQLLQRLQERRNNPTTNLEFRLRNSDSSKLVKYYNGSITLYPDYTIDTSGLVRKEEMVKGIKIIYYQKKFKSKIFPPNIYLPRDSVYRQSRYISTINRLNSLGAWRSVSIDQVPRNGQDTVDFIIRLALVKKFLFTTSLEGSINQTAISGNLFGAALNVGVQNRNFARTAGSDSWNTRFGIELGNTGSGEFIQSRQISLSRSIVFPRAILFDNVIPVSLRDNIRTTLFANIARTQRRFLFDQVSLNGAWGYEFQRNKLLLSVKLPNIEYSLLHKQDSLNTLIDSFPSLRYIFTDGLVFSSILNLTIKGGQKNNLNIFRADFEGSPLIAGFFHNKFIDTQLYRFIKIDAEFARLIRYKKTSIALRFFGGIGIADPFHSTVNPLKRNSLPFFKEYYGGGANSMRAWALRRLGPGSFVENFDGSDGLPNRYGDVQLETNAEYRFPIGKPFGIKVNGALFTDIGNIWLLKKSAGPPEEVFNFNQLGKDIAIGTGVGLRIDLDFLIIRFDYSYKVKDPSPSSGNVEIQNKWFGYPFFKGTQLQLGIGYPFIF
jgi:outer membrane protein assembly factor BamA